MQSNVTVPAGESKLRLWLLIVVLAVAIFGGAAYGYYSWYKTNEPPPSLEMKDGTGLQGLMKIQGGVADIEGFAKLEEADVKDVKVCGEDNIVELKGKEADYLYSSKEVTFKDIYESTAIKENVGRTFMFAFYSPGEEVGTVEPTKYSAGFYLFPTTGTNYKDTVPVKLEELANYKIPAYRSVILFHDDTMKVCMSEDVAPAGDDPDEGNSIDNEKWPVANFMKVNLKPLPKGWVLVPFGWNLENVEVLKEKLGGHVNSMWFKAGSGEYIKVKEKGLNGSLLEDAIKSTKTRSVWMNMKNKTDVMDIISQEDDKLAPSIFKVEYNEGKGSQAVFVSFSEKVKDFDLDGLCKLKEPEGPDCSGENLVEKEGAVKSADLKESTVNINLQSKLEPGNYKVSFSKVSDFSGNVSGDISHIFKIDPIVKKKAGEVCEFGGQCVEGLSCVLSEVGGVCGTAKNDKEVCDLVCGEKYPKCKVVDLKTDPVDVLCDPGLVKVCESDAGCDGGKKCVDVPEEYQEAAGGAKICAIPKGGKCDLNINCSPGLVCSKDKELGTSACVESECDVCGGLACTSLGDGGGFSSVTCGDVKDTKAPEVKCAVPGDVDGNGKVDCEVDAAALAGIINGKIPSTPCADVNGDGAVNSGDIQQLVVSFCPPSPKEICDNGVADDDGDKLADCMDTDCFGKTDMDGFTCCNGSESQYPNVDLCKTYNKFCDNDDLSGSYRCLECSIHTDCAGGYCEAHSCVDAPDVLSVVQGENSGVLKVTFSAPLGSQQFVPDFSVVSVVGQAVFQVSSVSADGSVLTLNMSQALSSGEYIFEAKSIILKSGSTVPLTINNKVNFTLAVLEVCGDKADNDGDGKKDCLDEECSAEASCVGECKVNTDCANVLGGFCVSVDGGAAQCKAPGDFSSVCPGNGNPNPSIHFDQQPVFIDCETTIK